MSRNHPQTMEGDAMKRRVSGLWVFTLGLAGVGVLSTPAGAQEDRVTVKSTAPFGRVAEALERAVSDEKMGLVCHANAQRAAAGRGGPDQRQSGADGLPECLRGAAAGRRPCRRLRGSDPHLRL